MSNILPSYNSGDSFIFCKFLIDIELCGFPECYKFKQDKKYKLPTQKVKDLSQAGLVWFVEEIKCN